MGLESKKKQWKKRKCDRQYNKKYALEDHIICNHKNEIGYLAFVFKKK